MKESLSWSIVWISLALLFNYVLVRYSAWEFSQNAELMALPNFSAVKAARQIGLEFLSGFLVEKSLAVDNLFVFVLVFKFFSIPDKYQHRVLFYGILGALIFRALFIALGAVLMQYKGIVIFFGLFLIFTGVKMFFPESKPKDLSKNIVIRLLKKIIPLTTHHHGRKFWVIEHGKKVATPLFLCLMFLEVTDIIFAVDSVPAIFALTKEPFIVFTSNIFAILGLRSLYFLLASVVDKFHFLQYGLALILIFVGIKMAWLHHLSTGFSLIVIGACLGLSIILSFTFPHKAKE